MKFRNPKTGTVFRTIRIVRNKYCIGKGCLSNCKLGPRSIETRDCVKFCDDHPAEAARLMGYEVIEDKKEVNMEKKDKPRLTEPELERCRVYGAKWVSRDDITDGIRIGLYREKPVKIGDSFFDRNASAMIATIWDETMFPSVHPGDCICAEEVGGE